MLPTGEKWILLGASRGLGFQFANKILKEKLCHSLVLASRKIDQTHLPSSEIEIEKWTLDFSDESQWENLTAKILSSQADRVFYFAGGGPYGNYQSKAWKDHQWAYRLNFEFPAFLLHKTLQQNKKRAQLVFIGSAVAESAADPNAASYSASKHALKGLITSVQVEILRNQASLDLRLYSPGYMDTGMLPPHAWPRQQAGKVLPPDRVADDLWQWLVNEHDANTQRVFNENSLLK